MKHYGLMVLLLLASLAGRAQNKPMEYLLDGKIKVSILGGPFVEFSSLHNDMVVSSGGGGALLLNRRFFIGGYGMNSGTSDNYGGSAARYDLRHGGFWLGGFVNPDKLVHVGLGAKIGWGEAHRRELGLRTTDNVFVASPEVTASVNITRWFKFSAGAGYRLVTGIREGGGLQAGQFSSPTVSLNFLFGWFGQ